MLDSTIVYSTFEQLNRYESRLAARSSSTFWAKECPAETPYQIPMLSSAKYHTM